MFYNESGFTEIQKNSAFVGNFMNFGKYVI